ncbi:MAG: hypothetical protein KDA92_25730 [Planctomycetales bacterium]|nr:hypothetical protein [Planctomycetales bacterium]
MSERRENRQAEGECPVVTANCLRIVTNYWQQLVRRKALAAVLEHLTHWLRGRSRRYRVAANCSVVTAYLHVNVESQRYGELVERFGKVTAVSISGKGLDQPDSCESFVIPDFDVVVLYPGQPVLMLRPA